MSPKRLNPESRVTPELLGDVSGFQREFARVAYRKARDGHGYRLPYFTVGNPATVRHERFEVETDYVRDPVTYELDSVPRVDWKLVPYGELLNSASERHPVRQTIEPADWYYNEDEKDKDHPNLLVVSGQLSVAGLATILQMNPIYRLRHEGSHGSYRRVTSWRDGKLEEMRQTIGEELGIDMSATADLRRGNVVLPDGDDRWMQRERKITHSGKLYTPKTSREVIRIKALELKEKAITPEIQEEISSLRKSIDGVLDDVRDPEMREQAANILARLRKVERGFQLPEQRSAIVRSAKSLSEQWLEEVWQVVPLYGMSHSGERETRHDLPHKFSFFTRTNGMTGRSIAYVIGPGGELVEPSESGYRRDDDKTWGPEVLNESVVILTHEKACTAALHEFGVRYEPPQGITEEQLNRIEAIQKSIAKEWDGATGMSGKESPSIGDGWGFTEGDLNDEAQAKRDAEINSQDMNDLLAALQNRFNN
jgi:hypothetical protein